MNKEKKLLLDETYRLFMNQGMGISENEHDVLTAIADEKLMGFGTTIDEKILSVDQFLELLEIQKEQSKGLELRWEIKPISHYTSADENTAIFADDLFLYVGVGSEMVEMYLRFSVIMVYQQNKWLVIHWHGSKPENVESEKDTFGIENWKKKAELLEKLVDERTADLVLKNRELEIEAALERVRATTMAMQHSDELAEASFLLDNQVRALGIKTRGCAFNIYGENESTEWFSSEMGTMPTYKTPRERLFLHYYNEGQKGKLMHVETFAGEACAAHYDYLCTLPVMGESLRKLKESGGSFPDQQTDHVVYFKYGYLLFITLDPVPEAHDIFIRFAKVFEQTYTRFLDLQKAEAHAMQTELDLIAIKEARQKAEDTLAELQVTQKQLIQSEKMASLGELTAGIAHEIQNPLNFVNNFSEVSTELVDEMNAEIDNGNLIDAKQIAHDLKQNLEKINHHGKRAGDIVKGMLQHSRSSGQKELSNINDLADEYLRLAYHGLRAKDKTFNATMKTDFDESIGNINIIPQDMGRVILNLITNAFYAVDEKKKSGVDGYEPVVSVSTKKVNDTIVIKVSDNGNGIPAAVKEKIFQPFFTTKPTGKGTGLGLSMSYDIVTKGHGGELKVENNEGEGATFIIILHV